MKATFFSCNNTTISSVELNKLWRKFYIYFQMEYKFFFSIYSLAIKNAEDNGPTKRDPASSDLLFDDEK